MLNNDYSRRNYEHPESCVTHRTTYPQKCVTCIEVAARLAHTLMIMPQFSYTVVTAQVVSSATESN